jgi:hypothetical protein
MRAPLSMDECPVHTMGDSDLAWGRAFLCSFIKAFIPRLVNSDCSLHDLVMLTAGLSGYAENLFMLGHA